LDFVGDSFDYVVGKAKQFLDYIGLTTFALDEAAKKEKESAMNRIKGTEEYYNRQIELAEIAGEDTAELEKEKWEKVKQIAQEGFKATLDSNNEIREEDLEDAKKFLIEEGKATHEPTKIALAERIHAAQVARLALLKESEKLRKDLKIELDLQLDQELKTQDKSFKALEDHLKKLVDAGHKLILFTMRSNRALPSETGDPTIMDVTGLFLDDAVNWLSNNEIPLHGINENPSQKNWTTSPKAYGQLYIDDAALGCPLLYNPEISDRPFVDWVRVEETLKSIGALS